MFAQSVLEYGSFSSALAGLQAIVYTVQDRVKDVNPMTWIAIVVIVLAAAKFSKRSPARR
jgi:hypothetical protein